MKFRNKPAVIDAFQWTGTNGADVLAWVRKVAPSSLDEHLDPPITDLVETLNIHTREGTMTVSPGDWVICGIKRELYSCKPDIFAATYEQVRTVAHYPDDMGEESRRLHHEYNGLVAAQRDGAKNSADVVRLTDECNAKGIILVPGGENL
jgi:hypothetical protein